MGQVRPKWAKRPENRPKWLPKWPHMRFRADQIIEIDELGVFIEHFFKALVNRTT
jgi:hypothetical protein